MGICSCFNSWRLCWCTGDKLALLIDCRNWSGRLVFRWSGNFRIGHSLAVPCTQQSAFALLPSLEFDRVSQKRSDRCSEVVVLAQEWSWSWKVHLRFLWRKRRTSGCWCTSLRASIFTSQSYPPLISDSLEGLRRNDWGLRSSRWSRLWSWLLCFLQGVVNQDLAYTSFHSFLLAASNLIN